MARIERIKKRLDNWALWKARQASSGLGFHSVNVLAVDVWGRSSYNGAAIPHFDQDAEETDQAVESLQAGKDHLYLTLYAIYMNDLGVQETARRTRKAPSTIHAHLEQADRAIDAWLQEQARIKEEKAALARGREFASRPQGV